MLKTKNEIRLYNLLFPVWLLLLIPAAWLYVIPANFIIDSAVVLITLSVLAKKRGESDYRPWRDWKRCILRVWLFGFISDLLGAGFMLFWGFAPYIISGDENWWTDHVTDPISANPFTDVFALIFTLLAIAVAGLLIFFFSMRITLKKTGLDRADRRRLALTLAIATAPYIMLFPSDWMWRMLGA